VIMKVKAQFSEHAQALSAGLLASVGGPSVNIKFL